MSALLSCGTCCFLISIWGTLQLSVMSICYYGEAVTLLEDVEEEEYEDYEDFIAKTKNNYQSAALNCMVAAIIYALFIAISYVCIKYGKQQMMEKERLNADDHLFCLPKAPPKTKPSKVE